MSQPGYPKTVRARALRMLRSGRPTVAEISRRLGVSRKTLQVWARAAGLPPRPPQAPPSTLTPEQQRQAVALYLAGASRLTIEIRTRATPSQVRRLVREAGHPLRTCPTHARIDTTQAVALADELGPSGAAKSLGCCHSTVLYHQEKARRERIRAELRAQEAKKEQRRA